MDFDECLEEAHQFGIKLEGPAILGLQSFLPDARYPRPVLLLVPLFTASFRRMRACEIC